MSVSVSQLDLLVSEDGKRFDRIACLEPGTTCDRIVGIVAPTVAHLVATAAALHVRANRLVNAVTLIVEDIEAPLDDRTAGLDVTSFLASGPIADALRDFGPRLEEWCYRLMAHVMAQHRVPCELRVVHKPAVRLPQPIDMNCDVVLPHRGFEAYLRLSVDSLLRQTTPAHILVAIDQADVGASFLADIADQPLVTAYRLKPEAVGPYVARHVLSMRSSADAVAFQDSDDVALSHRLATLAVAAARHSAGIVGSHELQVHEPHRKVYAIRYPLDVNASLRRAGPNHQLLFPTSLVQREVLARTGGFSTYRAFSLDVAFWLSASLTTRIVNVDDFLYVRRRHPASLTMRPDIGTLSDLRREIVRKRCTDFAAVSAGHLSVDESSLSVLHRRSPVLFANVKTGDAMIWSPDGAIGHRGHMLL